MKINILVSGGGAIWSLCVAKGITVISGAKSSEQNDDKTNNLDDVILHQWRASLSTL